MDMGTQNILVDQEFNFLAIIDWEFAQSAPLEVNHYPMPFPLVFSNAKIENILRNPDMLHIVTSHANSRVEGKRKKNKLELVYYKAKLPLRNITL
jgi:hypothetical protein